MDAANRKIYRLLISIVIIYFIIFTHPDDAKAANIVNANQTYSYETMVRDMKKLAKKYPDIIQYKVIGKSEYNRNIYAISLGTGNSTIFVNGSHHAREWITTILNMYMLEQYAKKYKANATYGGYNVKKILDETTIWFVPMVNPDGVTLQQYGLSNFPKTVHSSLIRMNEGSTNFKRWKANARGIDLNRQYNADWPNIVNNYSYPRWSNHKGTRPEQAAEIKAMIKFTKEVDPEITVAYHSSGEILYWYFNQKGKNYNRDYQYAKKLRQMTGYPLVNPKPNPSGGGYTDWFIQHYKRPGFTPELGRYAGNTHVPVSEFSRIWSQNRYVGLYLAKEGYKLYLARGGVPKYEEANVQIDGKKLKFDQPALIMKGTTMVPVRGVFEHMGASVQWNSKNKTVTVRKGTDNIVLTLGSKKMKVNGKSKNLGIAPQTINGRTLIPVRAVSESIGAKVVWDSKTKTVKITSPEIVNDTTPPAPPTVNTVTDVTEKVTGKTEANARVVVKKDGKVIGTAKANKKGNFTIKIPVQRAETKLLVTATDIAGNTSKGTEVIVSYTSTFTDTINHWAGEAVGYLKDEGVTAGLTDGSFGVNKQITRGEAATMLVRALNYNAGNGNLPKFSDVPKSHPFYSSIAVIAKEGIMTGRTKGKFHPSASLTRAEMAAILVKAFDLSVKGDASFSDVKPSFWAYNAITILASNGLVSGYGDGTFGPNRPITRAEFAAFLVRALQLEPADIVTQQVEEENPDESEEGMEEEYSPKENLNEDLPQPEEERIEEDMELNTEEQEAESMNDS